MALKAEIKQSAKSFSVPAAEHMFSSADEVVIHARHKSIRIITECLIGDKIVPRLAFFLQKAYFVFTHGTHINL